MLHKASMGQKSQWDKYPSGTNVQWDKCQGDKCQVRQLSSGTNVLWENCQWDSCHTTVNKVNVCYLESCEWRVISGLNYNIG